VSVTVVIPARNAGAFIGEQLGALAAQDYEGTWEVVIADDGSTDGTLALARQWADRLPALRIVDCSPGRGAGHARNVGAKAAHGEVIAYCDADDVVDKRWLRGLAAALASCDIAGGALEHRLLNDPAIRRWRGEEYAAIELPRPMNFLPFAVSCNVAVRADVLAGLGGWRTANRVCEDIELSWRAQLAGYRLAFAPDAVVHYRHRQSMTALAKQAFRFSREEAYLYKQFRSYGIRRRPARVVARSYLYPLTRLPYLVASPSRRGLWLAVASETAGRLAGSAREAVLYP